METEQMGAGASEPNDMGEDAPMVSPEDKLDVLKAGKPETCPTCWNEAPIYVPAQQVLLDLWAFVPWVGDVYLSEMEFTIGPGCDGCLTRPGVAREAGLAAGGGTSSTSRPGPPFSLFLSTTHDERGGDLR